MGKSHRLRDLDERGQLYVCADQAGNDRMAGLAPLLDCDVEIDGEGGVLDCW